MRRKEIDFLLAYADINYMMHKPFEEVLEGALDFLNSDLFMDKFLEGYNNAKNYGILPIIKLRIYLTSNDITATFLAICDECGLN